MRSRRRIPLSPPKILRRTVESFFMPQTQTIRTREGNEREEKALFYVRDFLPFSQKLSRVERLKIEDLQLPWYVPWNCLDIFCIISKSVLNLKVSNIMIEKVCIWLYNVQVLKNKFGGENVKKIFYSH